MSEKIKICHVTSAHNDGDVRIFHKECVSLAENGFEVYHLVPNSTTRIEKGVQIISFPFEISSRFKRMFFLVKEIYKRALEINADIYHLHDPELLRIALKLKKQGKKVIYDAHEDVPRDILSKPYIPKLLRQTISKRFEKYENKIASQIDGVITATPFIRDRFLKINKKTIDINNFPVINSDFAVAPYESKTANNICYLGSIVSIRGINELISALEKTECTLLLGGNFGEAGLQEKLIMAKGWEKVRYLGFLDRKQVQDVYNQSKLGMVTLHPTINYLDSLPVKMFEYMAAGIPVIASNFPYWKEIVEKNNCGVCVDPLNPEEISQAITYLLEHPEVSKQMGENGLIAVNEKYNWNAEKAKLIKFYTSIN
ncbi:MAG: glycosyltransferase family 4 protein [Crocinitomicaceae bacterium]|nr:glycosyltransferase family 4 protein [Crocinitomicaceae bacterium]